MSNQSVRLSALCRGQWWVAIRGLINVMGCLYGGMCLLGHLSHTPTLITLNGWVEPIDMASALGITLLGFGFLFIDTRKLWIQTIAAVLSMLVAIGILATFVPYLEPLLVPLTRVARPAMCVGICLFVLSIGLFVYGQKLRHSHIIYYACSVSVLGLAVLSMVAQYQALYSDWWWSYFIKMPVSLAIVLLAYGMNTVFLMKSSNHEVVIVHWTSLDVLFVCLTGTIVFWQSLMNYSYRNFLINIEDHADYFVTKLSEELDSRVIAINKLSHNWQGGTNQASSKLEAKFVVDYLKNFHRVDWLNKKGERIWQVPAHPTIADTSGAMVAQYGSPNGVVVRTAQITPTSYDLIIISPTYKQRKHDGYIYADVDLYGIIDSITSGESSQGFGFIVRVLGQTIFGNTSFMSQRQHRWGSQAQVPLLWTSWEVLCFPKDFKVLNEQLVLNNIALLAGVVLSVLLSVMTHLIRLTLQQTASIKRAIKAAEQANKAKSAFLSNMSHEIRTPLTAMLGFTELLQEHFSEDKTGLKYLRNISRGGTHLLQIINDILDISKIESGQLQVETIPFALADVIEDVRRIAQVKASEKDLLFEIIYQCPLPKNYMGDPTRLKQVIINMCSNALKFTVHGSVTLTITYQEQHSELTFSVRDTGVGIIPDKQQQIFEEFSQADVSTTRLHGGTGLGLCISKHLARSMGGDLHLKESTPGEGSTFVASVTAQVEQGGKWAQSPEELSASPIPVRKLVDIPHLSGTLVVAEDVVENQELLSIMLGKTGVDFQFANNGKEAVELVLTHTPDVVLMDIQMPEVDGIEACEILRGGGFTNPIVALTANVMEDEVDHYFEIGFSNYIAKPIEKERFYKILSQYLPAAASVPTVGEEPREVDSKEALMISLTQKFIKRLPDLVEDIVSAQQQDDYPAIGEVAHNLKGMGTTFGFPEISEAGHKLEQSIKFKNFESVPEEIETLLSHCRAAIATASHG